MFSMTLENEEPARASQDLWELAMGLNSRSKTDAILLKFSKAFDKMRHQRLSLKLHYYHHYGIRGNIFEWVRSFLDGRTKHAVLYGAAS